MKTTRIMAVAVLIVASGLAQHAARAQLPGTNRTDLQRHDLSIPGREVIQVRVEIAPGVTSPRHCAPRRGDRLYPRRLAGVSGRGQAAGDAQGRRRLVHSGRDDPRGEERRQRPRSGARHLHRRKREATPRGGEVSDGAGGIDHDRRRFLGTAAMMIAGGRLCAPEAIRRAHHASWRRSAARPSGSIRHA